MHLRSGMESRIFQLVITGTVVGGTPRHVPYLTVLTFTVLESCRPVRTSTSAVAGHPLHKRRGRISMSTFILLILRDIKVSSSLVSTCLAQPASPLMNAIGALRPTPCLRRDTPLICVRNEHRLSEHATFVDNTESSAITIFRVRIAKVGADNVATQPSIPSHSPRLTARSNASSARLIDLNQSFKRRGMSLTLDQDNT